MTAVPPWLGTDARYVLVIERSNGARDVYDIGPEYGLNLAAAWNQGYRASWEWR